MKYFFLTLFISLILSAEMFSQDKWMWDYNSENEPVLMLIIPEIEQPLTPISLKQSTGLSAVYLITNENQTISSSYVPTSSYRYRHPDNKELNCYITTGDPDFNHRDSYNPFGARSFEEAVVLGVVNTFFSKIMKNVQRK